MIGSTTNVNAKRAAISATFFNAAGEECGPHERPHSLRIDSADGQRLHVQLSPEFVTQAPYMEAACAWHGLKQKLVDAAAISRDPETGRSATPTEKFAAIEAVCERLRRGEWNAPRGEGTGATGGLLAAALVRLTGQSLESVREQLEALSPAEQAVMRAAEPVAGVIEAIRREREAAKPTADRADASALLARFGVRQGE